MFEELAGEQRFGAGAGGVGGGRGCGSPGAGWAGKAFEGEADVFDPCTEDLGGGLGAEVLVGHEVVESLAVEVGEFAAGQVESLREFVRGFPGERFVDAELFEVGLGVGGEVFAQRCGQAEGELEVVASVGRAAKGEGAARVGQVGAGEHLVQVALGVEQAGVLAGMSLGGEGEAAPGFEVDDGGGDRLAAAGVVDRAAVGVEVVGQPADRCEDLVVSVAGQGTGGVGQAYPGAGVQVGGDLGGAAAGVAGQQDQIGDCGAERVGVVSGRWE